jgi:hypothetical protein
MAASQGHPANLGWIAPQRNALGGVSVVVLDAKIGNKQAFEAFQTRLGSKS